MPGFSSGARELGEIVVDQLRAQGDGTRVLAADVAAVPPEQVAEAVVGREILRLVERPARRPAAGQAVAPVLSVRGLCTGDRLADIGFDLAPGEIVGLAGLIGSGRTELAHCLFGVDRPSSGTVELSGEAYAPAAPCDAIAAGVMLLPESRQRQGLVLQHSAEVNMLLPSLRRLRRGPLIDDTRGRALYEHMVRRLEITGPGRGEPVARLSGGNQQKVALAKWLALAESG
jgi:ribose transport system ATP-binding protein